MKNSLFALVLVALAIAGCSGVRVMPQYTLGDATYTMVEHRAGILLGPNVVVLDVYETKEGKTKLLHTNSSTTGGGLDALLGSGKILDSAAGAADKVNGTMGAAK